MIIDPTGKYIVTPDLGGDVCRVWSFDKKNIAPIAEAGTLKAPAGAGPRHGFFRTMKNGNTFFFFNGELDQKIYSYRVKYERASLSFTKAFEITSLNATFPSNTAPISEIAMSVSTALDPLLQLLTSPSSPTIDSWLCRTGRNLSLLPFRLDLGLQIHLRLS